MKRIVPVALTTEKGIFRIINVLPPVNPDVLIFAQSKEIVTSRPTLVYTPLNVPVATFPPVIPSATSGVQVPSS